MIMLLNKLKLSYAVMATAILLFTTIGCKKEADCE